MSHGYIEHELHLVHIDMNGPRWMHLNTDKPDDKEMFMKIGNTVFSDCKALKLLKNTN